MITAAFTDNDTMICAMPSGRRSGLYFVAVRPEKDYLTVIHSLLAAQKARRCT